MEINWTERKIVIIVQRGKIAVLLGEIKGHKKTFTIVVNYWEAQESYERGKKYHNNI